MVELLTVIEQVHKMADKGDFRNLGILLVQFYEGVMIPRKWGYNSFVSLGFTSGLSSIHTLAAIFFENISSSQTSYKLKFYKQIRKMSLNIGDKLS